MIKICYNIAAEMSAEPKYWKDGVHVKALGAAMKAELVAYFFFRTALLHEIAITQKQ